uniref:Nucleoside phosphorylase domain-containing protein n=1 Tax=Pyricularia oryzae (strain P131) TaxID=1143193 RepID=L7IQV1_PYRO1
MPPKKRQSTDYHVAWIAPVSDLELLPSRLMLDEEHDAPDYDTAYDDNVYTCGALAGHNVVIATCAPGMTGNVNAGRVTGSMFKTFSSIRMAVLVGIGIGGGVPRAQPSDDPTENVHLGDVVVGWPGDGGPASSNRNMIAMLSRDFGEQDRYEKTANAIATTWLISFEQITRDAPLAASYLRNIAYFAEKDIPISLLPDGREDWDKVEAGDQVRGGGADASEDIGA